jgi:hypothetical protein
VMASGLDRLNDGQKVSYDLQFERGRQAACNLVNEGAPEAPTVVRVRQSRNLKQPPAET